jgi:HlyD family secretion protein
MKRLLKYLKLLALIAVFALLIIMALWPKSATVDLARAERGSLTITIDEEGKTRVRDRFVISAPVAGRVQRIELEAGDKVIRNKTVVAIFNPADPVLLDVRSRTEAEESVKVAEAGLGRARAERERAAAEDRLAQSELTRMRSLYKEKIVAQQAFDSAESQARTAGETLRAAEFSVASAEHEVTLARARLLSTSREPGALQPPIILRAPITGVVLKRLRESESIVPAGEPLVELGDPRRLEIVSDFLSTDAVKMKPGDVVQIERWGGESKLHGRVRRIEPSGFMKVSALGVEEQRVSVLIDFDDSFEAWNRLGDGYRVEVRVIVWQSDNVLRVPTSSLFRLGEKWAVFAAENGRARQRRIAIGPRNGSHAQVLEGLSEGEIVIVHPSDTIKDGSRISPRSASETK